MPGTFVFAWTEALPVVSNILHFGWTKCANVIVKPFSSASYVVLELAALEDKLLKLILPSPVPRGSHRGEIRCFRNPPKT